MWGLKRKWLWRLKCLHSIIHDGVLADMFMSYFRVCLTPDFADAAQKKVTFSALLEPSSDLRTFYSLEALGTRSSDTGLIDVLDPPLSVCQSVFWGDSLALISTGIG